MTENKEKQQIIKAETKCSQKMELPGRDFKINICCAQRQD